MQKRATVYDLGMEKNSGWLVDLLQILPVSAQTAILGAAGLKITGSNYLARHGHKHDWVKRIGEEAAGVGARAGASGQPLASRVSREILGIGFDPKLVGLYESSHALGKKLGPEGLKALQDAARSAKDPQKRQELQELLQGLQAVASDPKKQRDLIDAAQARVGDEVKNLGLDKSLEKARERFPELADQIQMAQGGKLGEVARKVVGNEQINEMLDFISNVPLQAEGHPAWGRRAADALFSDWRTGLRKAKGAYDDFVDRDLSYDDPNWKENWKNRWKNSGKPTPPRSPEEADPEAAMLRRSAARRAAARKAPAPPAPRPVTSTVKVSSMQKRASMHDLVNPVLEKRARIFGAFEPDEITESAIPYERRLESYKNYLAEKSQEEPTSYPRAMLTGAAIGAIPAIPLAISSAPGIRRAVPALIGAGLGALGGALMSKADRGRIDWAKKVVDAGDQENEMIDSIRMTRLLERLRREEEHQELLDRLDELRNS